MSKDIVVVGLSHHTAPLALREKVALAAKDMTRDLEQLRENEDIDELVMISTCNRIELYAATQSPSRAIDGLRDYFGQRTAPTPPDPHLYARTGHEAVKHAFRVASSLDSMVLGEPQILGQMKQAYSLADRVGTTGPLLSRCFSRSFAVAKRVRSETGIAEGAVSISSIACELAKTVFGSLHGKRVLLVGAGKMSEAAAKYLKKHGAKLVVVNRSPERAHELAKLYGAEARGFDALESELVLADVVLSSTASPDPIMTRELIDRVVRQRRYRMLLLIDIAVPRDIAPEVAKLDNVLLYDIDDLHNVAEQNLVERRKRAQSAEQLVDMEVGEFEAWRRQLVLGPTIAAMRASVQAVVMAELERSLSRAELDESARGRLGEAIVNKVLHHAITELKKGAETPDGAELLRSARRLFDLDKKGDE